MHSPGGVGGGVGTRGNGGVSGGGGAVEAGRSRRSRNQNRTAIADDESSYDDNVCRSMNCVVVARGSDAAAANLRPFTHPDLYS
jgi:hypothetical protein